MSRYLDAVIQLDGEYGPSHFVLFPLPFIPPFKRGVKPNSYWRFFFIGSTEAERSPVVGGKWVIRVKKSNAMRCFPMPTMTRWDWSSEAMIWFSRGGKRTTFEVFFMPTT